VFFTALVPQFINPHAAIVPQVAILAATSVVIEFTVQLFYAALAGRAALRPYHGSCRRQPADRRRTRNGSAAQGLGADQRHAAVHDHGRSDHVVAGARGEIDRRARHVLIGADPARGDDTRDDVATITGVAVHVGGERTWRDRR